MFSVLVFLVERDYNSVTSLALPHQQFLSIEHLLVPGLFTRVLDRIPHPTL